MSTIARDDFVSADAHLAAHASGLAGLHAGLIPSFTNEQTLGRGASAQ